MTITVLGRLGEVAINSRAKGAAGEREFANFLRSYGYDARRGQQYNGLDGEDVVSELPYHFEVKRVERLNIYDAMEQSVRDAKDKVPVVAHRKNRKGWLITMRAEDWIKLVKL